MGMLAARITDPHICPLHGGGPVGPPCAPTVLTGKLPQARVTDTCICVGPPDMIVKGSTGVFINKLPAARMGDMTVHGGMIAMGCPTVLIGEVGGGGVGSPGMSMVDLVSNAAAFGSPGPQARALIGANQKGAYFCRRCTDG